MWVVLPIQVVLPIWVVYVHLDMLKSFAVCTGETKSGLA